MALSHWWMLVLADRGLVDEVGGRFASALAALGEDRAGTSAYADWQRAGEVVNHDAFPGYNALMDHYNPAALNGVSLTVFDRLEDDNCFALVSLRRCAPCAVLWQALGSARAGHLPGARGNMLLRADEVPAARLVVDKAYEGLNMDEAVSCAMALAGHSNDESEVREAIEALPRALREAERRQRGLITVSRHAM